MNKNNIIKGLGISIASLVFGFLAISVPFKFFDELTSRQMTIMFAVEIITYVAVGLIFLVINEKENQAKANNRKRTERKTAEIQRLNTEWIDLVA